MTYERFKSNMRYYLREAAIASVYLIVYLSYLVLATVLVIWYIKGCLWLWRIL